MPVPLSERLCAAICLGFAWWTVCAHSVVAAGGSLRGLMLLFAGSGVAWLALARALRSRSHAAPPPPPPPQPEPASPSWLQRGAIVFAGAAAGFALGYGNGVVAWALLVCALGIAAVPFLLLEPARLAAPLHSRSAELSLAAMAAFGALYTLGVHRPDTDDALYVNMAVAAVDLPGLPLLSSDTLHGLTELPMVLPIYRLHSYELWIGALSLLTGIPAVAVFHWIAAAFAGALVPLAHAALFRRLTPAYWPISTAALLVVLVAVGETHRWYGNFAFVRMWQGKAILLFVLIPLVYTYAIRFATRPDRASWLQLAAAQIAALGCSSAALWAAPAAALMAMCSVLRPGRRGFRHLATGALASAYLIVAGLLLKSGMSESVPELAEAADPIWGTIVGMAGDPSQVERALATVLGQGRLYGLGIACLFVSWACCPPGMARRFAIALPLATALVLLDPLTEDWVSANLTGPVYWRAAWALPIPILLALVLVTPLRLGGLVGRLACAALIATFALSVPSTSGFSRENGATLSWPRLKLYPAHRWAQRLNELAPGQPVVAPADVSTWIPVFHDHAHPLLVRHYLLSQRHRLGEEAYTERLSMTRFVAGEARDPRAAAIFEAGLARYGVKAVCLELSGSTAAARRILRRAGFVRNLQGTDMEIWVRE
jgi:hypothetical protein